MSTLTYRPGKRGLVDISHRRSVCELLTAGQPTQFTFTDVRDNRPDGDKAKRRLPQQASRASVRFNSSGLMVFSHSELIASITGGTAECCTTSGVVTIKDEAGNTVMQFSGVAALPPLPPSGDDVGDAAA